MGVQSLFKPPAAVHTGKSLSEHLMSFPRSSIPFALFAATAVIAAAPAPQAAPSADFAAVQQHLRAVATMTADFTQTDRNGRQLTGTIQLKRPGRIRFQYQKGVPLLVVGDGKAL